MNRRDTILALLAVGASPLAAQAQQQGKVWRIGFLGVGTASGYAYRIDALLAGLRDLGYVEGRNIAMEFRWAENSSERLLPMAAELVRLKVDIIVTHAAPGALAARQATSSIPIVITDIADAVASGVVESLAHPGGNVTGSTFFGPQLSAKRLEMLKEVIPRIARVAMVVNPTNSAGSAIIKETVAAAKAMKIELLQIEARKPADFEAAFMAIAQSRVDAVMIQDDPLFTPNRKALADLANSHRIPSAGYSEFAEAGGMIGYGLNFLQLYRRAAYFVNKILNGTKPADLPVEQATTFELVVNRKTAKMLGLSIPQSILVRADRVIE